MVGKYKYIKLDDRTLIHDSEISIIIQGPIHEIFIEEIITQTRKIFQNSEIIVSTWTGSNKDLIPTDVILVQNTDPGGAQISDHPVVYDSANRQIISTLAGVKKASRKYSIKMRSDILFEHNDWLKMFNRYQKYDQNFKFLRSRVLIGSFFCVNANKIPLPYHISDWFFFGLTDDLIDIFDIPLLTEESANWFKGKIRNEFSYGWHCRYRPEQHIWSSFIKKHYKLNFDHQNDSGNNNIEISERIFANNTLILDPQILGMKSKKHPNYLKDEMNKGYFSSNYSFHDWLRLYRSYSDESKKCCYFNYGRWKTTLLYGLKNITYSIYLIFLYNGLLRYSFIRMAKRFLKWLRKLT